VLALLILEEELRRLLVERLVIRGIVVLISVNAVLVMVGQDRAVIPAESMTLRQAKIFVARDAPGMGDALLVQARILGLEQEREQGQGLEQAVRVVAGSLLIPRHTALWLIC
jgi:hypothetical protein